MHAVLTCEDFLSRGMELNGAFATGARAAARRRQDDAGFPRRVEEGSAFMN